MVGGQYNVFHLGMFFSTMGTVILPELQINIQLPWLNCYVARGHSPLMHKMYKSICICHVFTYAILTHVCQFTSFVYQHYSHNIYTRDLFYHVCLNNVLIMGIYRRDKILERRESINRESILVVCRGRVCWHLLEIENNCWPKL